MTCGLEDSFTDRSLVPAQWQLLNLALLVLATARHIARAYYRPIFNPDKLEQLGGALSLLAGNGYTIIRADTNDLARTISDPILGWPPGYSIIAATLTPLTGSIWWAAFLIDVLSTCIFFGSWYVILRGLRHLIPEKAVWIIWAFWGLVYSPLDLADTSSDQLSLAFFSACIALGMISVAQFSLWRVSTVALCAGGAAFLKFNYWPLLAVPPVCFGVLGLKNRRYWLGALVCSAPLLIAGVLYPEIRMKYTEYLGDPIYGYYWKNLSWILPFPTLAFRLHLLVPAMTNEPLWDGITAVLLWSTSIIGFAALIQTSLYLFLLFKEEKIRNRIELFFFLNAALTTLLVLSTLIYRSVREPVQMAPWKAEGIWTYVLEFRYYAPVSALLIVIVVIIALGRFSSIDGKRILQGFCIVLLLSSALFNLFLDRSTHTYHRGYMQVVTGWLGLLRLVPAINSRMPIIYVDSRESSLRQARLVGAKPLAISDIPSTGLKTQGPVLILVPVRQGQDSETQQLAKLCYSHDWLIIGIRKGEKLCQIKFGFDAKAGQAP